MLKVPTVGRRLNFSRSTTKAQLIGSNFFLKILLSFMIIATLVIFLPVNYEFAEGGSYTIKWYAADPEYNRAPYSPTYEKISPELFEIRYSKTLPILGRQDDPLENAVCYGTSFAANQLDAVTSLMPKGLALGQIVPFEIEISVTGPVDPENGTIVINPSWATKTTNGNDFGFDPSKGVVAAFVDYGDSGTIDPDGDATVTLLDWDIIDPGDKTEAINGFITVGGLDSGDNVVVEVWVVLKDKLPATVGGNVATTLTSAYTVFDTPDTISTGKQTVPLLQVGDFESLKADLAITKSDTPDPVAVGDTITYTILVENNSTDNVIANGVIVTDTLGPNLDFVEGSVTHDALTLKQPTYDETTRILTIPLDALIPGQVVTISFDVTVLFGNPMTAEPGIPDTPDRTNTAVVDAITDDDIEANNSATAVTGVLAPAPDITVTKTANPTSVPETGGDVDFTFVITNNNAYLPVTVTSISDTTFLDLLDEAEAANGGSAIVLQPSGQAGDSFSFTLNDQLLSGDYGGDDHYNVVTVVATDDFGRTDTDDDDATVTFTDVLPDISIVKTANPASVPETGANVEFTIVITNNGLEDVIITSLLDSDFDLAAHCPDAVDTLLSHSDTLTCVFTEFVAGDFESGVPHNNIATVIAADDDGNTDTEFDDATVNFTDVEPLIDVEKSVWDGTEFVDADETTGPYLLDDGTNPVFKFVVTNIGTVALNNINFYDTPPITQFYSDQALQNPVMFESPTTLAPSVSFIVYGSLPWNAGQNTDTASVSGSITDGAANVETASDTDDANYFGAMPALSLDKTGTFDAGADGFADVGELITYEFEVFNTGNVTLTGVTLSDPMLGSITLSATTIPVGGSVTGSATYAVTQDDIDAGTVYNIATADSNESGPDDDDETVTLPQNPAIDIEKATNGEDADTAPGVSVIAGSTVNWTYVVTNTGNVTLTGITVVDDQGVTVSLPKTTLDPGASMTGTALGIAIEGQYTNIGIATGTPPIGNNVTDSDPSNYYGLPSNQPSIQINTLTAKLDTPRTILTGTFNITDESEAGRKPDGFEISLTDYQVDWEYAPVDGSFEFSDFNGQAGGTLNIDGIPVDYTVTYAIVNIDGLKNTAKALDPGETIIFDESVTISYICTFDAPIPDTGTLRGTARAAIFNRLDRIFTYSSSFTLGGKKGL